MKNIIMGLGWVGATLVMAACDGPAPPALVDDAGAGDASAELDAGPRCTFSILCDEGEICVDGDCVVASTIPPEDLEYGELVVGEPGFAARLGLPDIRRAAPGNYPADRRRVVGGEPVTEVLATVGASCWLGVFGSALRMFTQDLHPCGAAATQDGGAVFVGTAPSGRIVARRLSADGELVREWAIVDLLSATVDADFPPFGASAWLAIDVGCRSSHVGGWAHVTRPPASVALELLAAAA